MRGLVATIAVVGIAVVAGCAATPLVDRLTLPEQFTVARHRLLVHSDFPLPERHRTLDELMALDREVARQLELPGSDEPIHVYLFESVDRFNGYMRLNHAGLPERRAFFLETDTRLVVYAQWGDRMAEDLRHEVTHAYLHSVVRGLPLWLDEGLAEYYEVPQTGRGFNRAHVERLLDRMRRHDWQPNLAKLEALADDRDLDLDEYAESWAWVHFMLESSPTTAQALRNHLARLRLEGRAEPLSATLQRLVNQPERALWDHLLGLSRSLPRRQ